MFAIENLQFCNPWLSIILANFYAHAARPCSFLMESKTGSRFSVFRDFPAVRCFHLTRNRSSGNEVLKIFGKLHICVESIDLRKVFKTRHRTATKFAMAKFAMVCDQIVLREPLPKQ